MSRVLAAGRALSSVADTALDRCVVPGYSRVGFLLRRHWWPADPPPGSLAGRTAVVTGANSGLGKAAAAGLAGLGARVYLVVRDAARGERARAELAGGLPSADLRVRCCDVSSLADVRRFARELAAAESRVAALVHNAGTLPATRAESVDGHELTLATHVLGPFLLTGLLAPQLAGGGRVVFVTSGGMYTQPLRTDDWQYRRERYRGTVAYARSKRMQVALAEPLAATLGNREVGVHAMHPGWADTPGVASALPGFHRLLGPVLRSPEEGADTIAWLAAADEPAHHPGQLWHDRAVRPKHLLSRTRETPAQRQLLWRLCAETTGIEP